MVWTIGDGAGGSAIVGTRADYVNQSRWTMITLTANRTQLAIYINGLLANTSNGTFVLTAPSNTGIGLGRAWDASLNSLGGSYDEVSYWHRRLSPVDVLELYNGGQGLAYPFPASGNFSITANDIRNNNPLTTFQAAIKYPSFNPSLTPFNANGWYDDQSITNPSTVGINSMTAGNVAGNSAGFRRNATAYIYPGTFLFNISGTASQNFSFYVDNVKLYSSAANAVAREINISTIQTGNMQVYCEVSGINSCNGFVVNHVDYVQNQIINYSTVAGIINTNIPYNTSAVFDINVTSSPLNYREYNAYNISLGALDANLYTNGSLFVRVFDLNTSNPIVVTPSNITILFNSDENQVIQRIPANQSSGWVDNLSLGQLYTVVASAPGYTTAIYSINYSQTIQQAGLDIYLALNSTTTNVRMFVVNELRTAFPGVTVTAQRFVNGSYTTVGSQTTDASGSVVFPLDTTQTYRIIVSAPGYIESQTIFNPYQIAAAATSSITIQIVPTSSAAQVSSNQNVFYQYSPTNYTLYGGLVNFTLSAYVYNTTDTLLGTNLSIYNGSINSGNLVGFAQGTNTTLNNLITQLNTSLYFNRTLFVVYGFQKDGYDYFSITVPYSVIQPASNASIVNFQQWLNTNVSNLDKMILFIICIFVVAVLMSVFVKGQFLVIASILFTTALAGVFFGAIGLFIAGMVAFIAISFIAATGAL